VVATTINEESHTAAAIPEEIRQVLDVIAPRCAKSLHPIVVPPIVGQISHASGEVHSTEINDGVEVVDKALTREFD
jgi:hypothetical protein